MDNFFFNNKTSSNYSRTYSKGTSFKFSTWDEQDTYNNDEFVVDFVKFDQKLWAALKTSIDEKPFEGSEYWELVLEGVSDIEFKQKENKILWKYEDENSGAWRDLFELTSVTESDIELMLDDIFVSQGSTYDVKLSETSTNAVQNQAVTKKFNDLDDKNTRTDVELTNIKSSINAALSNSKTYTDSKISEAKIQIDSELNKKANQTDVNEVVDVLNESINLKVDKVSGKGLSSNDFDDNYKSKLDNLDSSLNSTLTSAKSHTNSEIIKVDNKINSEISRAQLSETNLSGRIDDLEEDLVDTLKEAKDYTDSLANGEVKNNTDKINTLNGTGEGSVIKTVKDEISNLVGTAPEKLDTLQEIADYLEEHEDMASGLVNSLSELEAKKADKTELNNLKTETDSALQSLEKSKANTTGYYPDLSVGFADDLVGRGESVHAEFNFRASGGKSIKDGRAYIKAIKGNSVVWNNIAEWRGVGNIYKGITVTYEGGKVNMQGIAEDTTIPFYSVFYDDVSREVTFPKNHYYLIRGASEHFRIDVYNNVSVVGSNCITQKTGDVLRLCLRGQGLTIGQEVNESFAPQVIDLTQMFGAGNEPTTIEEFYARKPIVEDEYAYNEGEVIHCNTESIKSVGDNALSLQWAIEDGRISDTSAATSFVPNTIYRGVAINGLADYRYVTINSIKDSQVTFSGTYGYGLGFFVKVLPNEQYWLSATSGYNIAIVWYDADKRLIVNNYSSLGKVSATAPSNAAYAMIVLSGGASGEERTYDSTMLTLVHSGWKQDTDAAYQPYWEDNLIFDQRIKDEFPNGMSKWDMVYNKNGKGYIVKGTGVVDLGDLGGWYLGGSEGQYWATVQGPALPTSRPINNGTVAQVLCKRYVTTNWHSVYNGVQGVIGLYTDGQIGLVDSAITSVEDIPAALAGVQLYYQLAEPTIIEYDEPFNLDYRVADFGTEQAISHEPDEPVIPSAPFSADIIYQFNAVDMIREHELEIVELQSIITELQSTISTMQASITSLGGVINQITVEV